MRTRGVGRLLHWVCLIAAVVGGLAISCQPKRRFFGKSDETVSQSNFEANSQQGASGSNLNGADSELLDTPESGDAARSSTIYVDADLGAACMRGLDCAKGRCIDGFCCDSPCQDSCASCAVAGSEGTCSPESGDAAGCPALTCLEPTECMRYDASELANNCLAIGECRTQAECQPLPVEAGTVCGEAEQGLCDGEGRCVDPNKASLGEACQLNDDCTEGSCVVGPGGGLLCCDQACDGECEQCSAAGRCDGTPSQDVQCPAVVCQVEDNVCREYVSELPAGVCRALGECRDERNCLGQFLTLKPAADCNCGADGSCRLKRGIQCDADSECGSSDACEATVDGSLVCCAEACGGELSCSGAGLECLECEGTALSCQGNREQRCEDGRTASEYCVNGCTPGLGCNALAPVGFACDSQQCVAGAVCQADVQGQARCCSRDCGAEGKLCNTSGSCECANGLGQNGDDCQLQQAEPCGNGGPACGNGLSCVDGICCDGACGLSCESCNLTGRVGVCSFDSEDSNLCGAGQQCTGRGECKLDLGQSCQQGNACESNQCEARSGNVSGSVCCAQACDGNRPFCTSDGGRCVECQSNQECANGCNVGQGQCNALRGNGQTCSVDEQCQSGGCVADSANGQLRRCCSNCQGGQLCSANGQCVNPPQQAGQSCNGGAQCEGGLFCRDGVCCLTSCDSPCEQCGANGQCNVLPSVDAQCGITDCGPPSECVDVQPPLLNQCQSVGVCSRTCTEAINTGASCEGGGICNSQGQCIECLSDRDCPTGCNEFSQSCNALIDNERVCEFDEQCESGRCLEHYFDQDDDDFAPSTVGSELLCAGSGINVFRRTTRRPTSVATTDCFDDNDLVFPGQTRLFSTPAARKVTLPFDYNCDGQELNSNDRFNREADCAGATAGNCAGGSGWTVRNVGSGIIPGCGDVGNNGLCGSRPNITCTIIGGVADVVRSCR